MSVLDQECANSVLTVRKLFRGGPAPVLQEKGDAGGLMQFVC